MNSIVRLFERLSEFVFRAIVKAVLSDGLVHPSERKLVSIVSDGFAVVVSELESDMVQPRDCFWW